MSDGRETSGPPDRREATLDRIRADLRLDTAHAFVRLAADYLERATAAAGSVSPASAAPDAAVDFRPPASGSSLDDVLAELATVIDGANRLWHPMYMGHQVAAPLPAAIWTEPVIAALNQSMAVREMSPSATPIENGLIRWMSGLVWGDERAAAAAGTFTSGGTEAIFTSLLAARNAALPDAASDGVRAPAAIVCGEHAHYAVRRAAAQLGLGASGVAAVRSSDHRMDLDDLARTLDRLEAEGVPIVAVVATAGSTATGAFDDLARIGAACEERRLWLHVDAAHGGSALLSDGHRHRLAGIEHAHSISWDAHKMMMMPLAAGVVLVRDAARLEAAFGQDAPYLFGAAPGRGMGRGMGMGEEAGGGDLGLRSFLCSRRADAIQVWVALRRYGVDGIAALYDAACDRALELHDLLESHAAFETIHRPECNILCFRYVGAPRLGEAELDSVNLSLRARYNASGMGWITSTLLNGKRVLRVVLMNPLTDSAHLNRLVDALTAAGADVAAEVTAGGARPAR